VVFGEPGVVSYDNNVACQSLFIFKVSHWYDMDGFSVCCVRHLKEILARVRVFRCIFEMGRAELIFVWGFAFPDCCAWCIDDGERWFWGAFS
jgi:hypothetical protein